MNRAVVLVVALSLPALASGCLHGAQTQRVSYANMNIKIAVPTPTPTPWPSYAAIDVAVGHHPHLSAEAGPKLRYILAHVRPCQRRFVRYAFEPARWRGGPNGSVVMFFGPAFAGTQPHALLERNVYFDPVDGTARVFPGMAGGGYTLAADVKYLGCPKGYYADP